MAAVALCLATSVVACARGDQPAGLHQPDAASGAVDAARGQDAAAGHDAPQVLVDAAVGSGSGSGSSAPACAIVAGATPAIDGVNDLGDYAAANALALGAPLGSDGGALTWDATNLYVTVTSDAFEDAFEPLHIYVEAGTALAAATPATGKEYSGLVPQLPFTPTHLIAARQVSDSGDGGPYDGVYAPDNAFDTLATPLAVGANVFVSSDDRTISVVVPWVALGGCPTHLRLAMHVVHAVPANEWKELVPATTTPWQAPGGDYFDIDLTQPPAVASFALD